MKKIMFNDRYGLTAAVLQGRKTMTRRICKEYATHQPILTRDVESFRFYPNENIVEFLMKDGTIKVSVPPYKDNEVVAVAQSYYDVYAERQVDESFYEWCILHHLDHKKETHNMEELQKKKGWSNKMFVRPDLMPHQIIMGISDIESLWDITTEDCLKEGIKQTFSGSYCYEYTGKHGFGYTFSDHPKKAFATLINRPGVGRKGLWEENPFVFAYSFKLIK